MLTRLQAANDYIANNQHKVTNRPHFHFTPEIGWINDPNGFSFYKGEYHLFYQLNPYDIVWHNIHWGHATTNDFLNWSYKPVAMANDKTYDANGCFSGSAIEKDGKLHLLYTGHIDPNLQYAKDESQIKQYQCLAVSEDGIHFEKHASNPVIAETELPEGYLICDFRDPKVWEVNGTYYCVIVVRNAQRRGEILMFKSDDLVQWSFASSIYEVKFEENTLLECPDFFHLDGKDVLFFSVMPCDPEFEEQVTRKVAYAIGTLDYESGKFNVESEDLIDYGSNFYAPQTTSGEHGERLLIGWMQSWTQAKPPAGFEFNGMMSMPRQLSVVGNQLLQKPAQSVAQSFKHSSTHENIQLQANESFELMNAEAAHIQLAVPAAANNHFVVELQKNEQQSARIVVDIAAGKLVLESDYSNEQAVEIAIAAGQSLTLDVYIDLYSIELFVNAGEKVCTLTSYEPKGSLIALRAVGEAAISEAVCSTFVNE